MFDGNTEQKQVYGSCLTFICLYPHTQNTLWQLIVLFCFVLFCFGCCCICHSMPMHLRARLSGALHHIKTHLRHTE
uniref:Uncharacterized protein n=1 Tax=Anguilla anguilla TaxID=7936 RepID=A0A0E9WZE5_ANGAN